MADIKQAAEWMREGKRVRRAALVNWVLRIDKVRGGALKLRSETGYLAKINAQDLLADDWEIAD
jgi:hypothetical protein